MQAIKINAFLPDKTYEWGCGCRWLYVSLWLTKVLDD